MSVFGGVLSNPTMMYRKSSLAGMDEYYDTSIKVSADLHFFEKTFAFGWNWVVLSNIVLQYRIHATNTTKLFRPKSREEVKLVIKKAAKRFIPDATDVEQELHMRVVQRLGPFNNEEKEIIKKWCYKLIDENKNGKHFPQSLWLPAVANWWKAATSLCNIANPVAGYLMYKSLPALRPYIGSLGYFLYDWQKRVVNHIIKKENN